MAKQSDITVGQAAQAWLESLADAGGKRGGESKESTVYRYGKDVELVVGFFGSDNLIKNVLPARVAIFLRSDALLKLTLKSGEVRVKAPPTVTRTTLVLRRIFEHALKQDWIEKLPWPQAMPLPHQKKEAKVVVSGSDANDGTYAVTDEDGKPAPKKRLKARTAAMVQDELADAEKALNSVKGGKFQAQLRKIEGLKQELANMAQAAAA